MPHRIDVHIRGPIENDGQPVLRVDIPGSIESLATTEISTPAAIEVDEPVTVAQLRDQGLTDDQIPIMARTLFTGYQRALNVAREQWDYARGADKLPKAAALIQRGLDLLLADKVGYDRLVKKCDGNIEEIVRWLDIPHRCLSAHLERHHGPPRTKDDLRVFLKTTKTGCEEAGIAWSKADAARIEREGGRQRTQEPLGWQLARKWTAHFFPGREKEIDTILGDLERGNPP